VAVISTDVFAISRAGALYRAPLSDVLAYIQANTGTSEYRVATIAARNALTNLSVGDRVMVDDATGDATVTVGWALYMWLAASTWRKIAEQEGMDVSFSVATNLSYIAAAGQGTVASDTGTDAVIPAVTISNAGLMLPTDKVKTDHLTVTAATNLDLIRDNSHAPVTATGTPATNPIEVVGQTLTFNIAALASAP
jgi:hypothetical protein